MRWQSLTILASLPASGAGMVDDRHPLRRDLAEKSRRRRGGRLRPQKHAPLGKQVPRIGDKGENADERFVAVEPSVGVVLDCRLLDL
jgi:hypothetical protein